MRNTFEHLETPFLNEDINALERPEDGPAPWREEGDDELEDPAAHEGFGAAARDGEDEPEHETEDEARCSESDAELVDREAELFDQEAWSGSSEQIAFRDRVLAAHLAQNSGPPERDLAPAELGRVDGSGVEMRRDAAEAASRLLAAANADLAQAQQRGDVDALRTLRLTATSGYRSPARQRSLWLEYFPGYYKKTRAAREGLRAGPHSDEALAYMLKPRKAKGFGLGGRIAAPGYSNHQRGIAIDLKQERKKGHEIYNDSGDGPRAKWRRTWFHGWLHENATKTFGFKPLASEEWHWDYRGGGSATAGGGKPAVELTRFAQQVLNAVQGERLDLDGDSGPRTRAALERFRRQHSLGSGSQIDAATELALAQRALEELAQASMFPQPGVRDPRTEQELIRFRSARGLGFDAKLDAATRRALGDALAARVQTAPAPAKASPAAAPTRVGSTPTAFLGGKLWTFQARVVSTPVAVFCPPAALGRREVEVLVYGHGLLHPCKPVPKSVDDLITSAPFRLGSIVARSNRPIVLVVPLLDWANPGGRAAFGAAHPRWHALGKPAHLNALVDEVRTELGRAQSGAAPALTNLVVAGHSRAYDLMEPLAQHHADPQMQQGALALLSEVWALDSTYGSVSLPRWQAWLAASPRLQVRLFYIPGSSTAGVGDKFYKARGGRLSVVQVTETHCAVPGKRLPGLLMQASASDQEAEDTWGDDEAGLDELVETEGDDEATFAEDLLADAHTTDAYELDEPEADDDQDEASDAFEPEAETWADEGGPGSEEEFEFEDEDYAELALEEEEIGDKSPLAMPADNPVPFAPAAPAGSYWPVRTKHKSQRLVSYMYQAPSGIVGRAGRMFLAGRKGKVGGRTVLRWHCGVDVFAYANDVVVACEAGRIVDFSFFYKAKSGQRTFKLLIEHEGSGIVINYGEVRSDSLSKNGLQVGSRVAAGQPIGWVSDTAMLHFETYIKGTATSHRWWKSEKNPPRELLNPTRYLLELAQTGSASTASGAVQVPPQPTPQASSSAKPAGELVRFAQRVLNAVEGERLGADGDPGPLTRAALARFRQKHALGPGSSLDETTALALAQRALEELKQQSVFAQPGALDARTREELAAFRAQQGLGFDAKLDAATRSALADALARRTTAQSAPRAPTAAASAQLPTLPTLGAGRTPPADPSAYRKFRLTTYHVVNQADEPTGSVRIPILDDRGRALAEVSPSFFAKLSLEGTGRLVDGRLINVTGKRTAVSHDTYAPVLEHHRKAYAKGDRKRVAQGRQPSPTTYSGIVTRGDRVVEALTFHEVDASKRGVGYGMARGVAYTPFRTLAADIGTTKYAKVDSRWRGKDGLVPPGTHVYIKEYDGLALPDGTTHDGWFIVNDTGGAIFGAHFDVFTGSEALRKQVKVPAFGQVWFEGIEKRIPAGYTYGLTKNV